MPIPNPILDNRSYQQLRDELVRRIPVYTPEWTDFNPSDPGITLIELFAFHGENLLYRFNQLPETAKLEFLRLLQIPLEPAQAARVLITAATKLCPGTSMPIGSRLKAGSVLFQTTDEAVVWPVSFTAVARAPAPAPDPQAEPEVYDFTVRALDAVAPLPQGQQPVYYTNEIVDLNNPPVDFSAAVDRRMWVAALSEPEVTIDKLHGALLNLGVVLDPDFSSIDAVDPCPGAGSFSQAPTVAWKISASQLDNHGAPVYLDIVPVGDTTRGLTQNGIVRFQLPQDTSALGVPQAADPDKLGTGDFPPTLDTQKQLLFWLYAFPVNAQDVIGKIQFVAANAAFASQTSSAPLEFLGKGDGQPSQTFNLINKPIIDGSITLQVEEAGTWTGWTQVEDFTASKLDDRHYMVDLEAGVITTGDGFRGYPPQIGQRVRAVGYNYGGGAAGNVLAGAIKLAAYIGDIAAQNPLPAFGGSDSETIADGLTRIPGELRRRDRAVTAGDFEELALETPGADLGRAQCLPRFYPPTKQSEAAGVVSVVVWPSKDAAHPNAPVPDRNTLQTVCRWLDQRRLVTTELYVIPPTYQQIAVAIGLQVKDGYGIDAVRRWVELVVRQYLAPLPPYGPEGQGWPLGARVYGPELQAAALQVEGVQYLTGLSVARWDGSQWQPAQNDTVELDLWEVPELSQITVVDGTPLPPGQTIPPPPPVVAVPIPVLRDEC